MHLRKGRRETVWIGDVTYRFNAVYEHASTFRNYDTDTQHYALAPVVRWRLSPDTAITFNLDFSLLGPPWLRAGLGALVPVGALVALWLVRPRRWVLAGILGG